MRTDTSVPPTPSIMILPCSKLFFLPHLSSLFLKYFYDITAKCQSTSRVVLLNFREKNPQTSTFSSLSSDRCSYLVAYPSMPIYDVSHQTEIILHMLFCNLLLFSVVMSTFLFYQMVNSLNILPNDVQVTFTVGFSRINLGPHGNRQCPLSNGMPQLALTVC